MARQFSKPTVGQSGWATPLNAALDNLDGRLLRGAFDVQEYGAAGNGSTDDTAAITAAITATPSGGTVYLPAGVYKTTSPITVPPGVSLRGATRTYWWPDEGGTPAGILAPNAVIRPASTFSGTAVVQVLDKATGGYSAAAGNTAIENVSIDGGNLPGGNTVDGFHTFGSVQGLTLRYVAVQKVGGHGFASVFNTGTGPGIGSLDQVDAYSCVAFACGGDGFHLYFVADSTFTGCHSIGNVGNAWWMQGAGNNRFIGCKGEWSATGWTLDYPASTGGRPRFVFLGCGSDNNSGDGFVLQGDATGGIVQLVGCDLHADGHTASATSSGLRVNGAKYPIVVEGCSVHIGATSTTGNGPSRGFRTENTPTLVMVGNCYFQGSVNGRSTDGTGTTFVGAGVLTSDGGTPSSPSTAFAQAYSSGGINAFGSIDIGQVGAGLKVAEGTNAKQGTATLNGVTNVVVSNTSVTANSRIFLTINTKGGVTPGVPHVVTRTAGTSFTIASTVVSDNSVVAYEIIEPG